MQDRIWTTRVYRSACCPLRGKCDFGLWLALLSEEGLHMSGDDIADVVWVVLG